MAACLEWVSIWTMREQWEGMYPTLINYKKIYERLQRGVDKTSSKFDKKSRKTEKIIPFLSKRLLFLNGIVMSVVFVWHSGGRGEVYKIDAF